MRGRRNGNGDSTGTNLGVRMSDSIERVAVIGSGVMGAGIAAHCANAGCEVLLLLSLIHISEPTRP